MLQFIESKIRYIIPAGLDCNLLGVIGMHYAYLRLGLGLALVFSET